jgi:hypothetical protein
MQDHQTVLIIGFVWPEPGSSAAGQRMMQLVDLFLSRQWHVTFASAAAESAHSADFSPLVRRQAISLNSSDFDEFVSGLSPSIVLFDRFLTEEQFGWRVAKSCPDAIRILDTEDLQCLRRARHRAVKSGKTFDTDMLFSEETAKREIASIYRCDLSLIISEFEMQLLTETFRIDPSLLLYLPLEVEIQFLNKDFAERSGFMFIGNFLHDPNADAIRYLSQKIWPEIRRLLPDAMMHVYGAYPMPGIEALHNENLGFLIHGRAEDSQTVISNARVMLAPLRFGAGIKGKLLEAMTFGTPSITTTVGAESMSGGRPWNGFITDDPTAFAEAAVKLYTDAEIWRDAVANGYEIISSRYRKGLFSDALLSAITSVGESLESHRMMNFTGSMLHYHTMRSTEFMSRWIEEKNKKSDLSD